MALLFLMKKFKKKEKEKPQTQQKTTEPQDFPTGIRGGLCHFWCCSPSPPLSVEILSKKINFQSLFFSFFFLLSPDLFLFGLGLAGGSEGGGGRFVRGGKGREHREGWGKGREHHEGREKAGRAGRT